MKKKDGGYFHNGGYFHVINTLVVDVILTLHRGYPLSLNKRVKIVAKFVEKWMFDIRPY